MYFKHQLKKILVWEKAHLDWSLWRDELAQENVELCCEPEESVNREGTLYITDDGQKAGSLQEKGYAVLGLVHPGNSWESFRHLPYVMEYSREGDVEYLERVYRRWRGIPWMILETERLFIRETVEEDVEDFWAIYSDAAITRYTEGLYPSVEEERNYIGEYRRSMYGFYGFGVWTLVRKDTGRIVGRAGFSLREGYEEPELGFVIGRDWQRQGYCREACRAILEYGWNSLDFAGVQALVRPGNLASEGVCRLLGMEPVGMVTEEGIEYMRWMIGKKFTKIHEKNC